MPQKTKPKRKTAKQNHLRHLHVLRVSCFGFLAIGLLTIQAVTHIFAAAPQPQQKVLGYATSVSIGDLHAANNQARAANGLGGLALNGKLNSGAQAKANHMIANNYWSHTAPDGTEPWYFFSQAGYAYSRAGENLAYGFDSSGQITDAWMNSPGHKANILGDFTEVGYGFASGPNYQGAENTVVVAFYGKPVATAPAPAPKPSTPPPANVTPAPPAPVPAPTPTPAPTPGPVAVVSTPTPEEVKQEETPAPTPTTQEPKKVTVLETALGGQAGWAIYASLGVVGFSTVGFATTHWQLVRRGWKQSGHFILVHPLLDTAVVAVIIAIVLSTTAGFIK